MRLLARSVKMILLWASPTIREGDASKDRDRSAPSPIVMHWLLRIPGVGLLHARVVACTFAVYGADTPVAASFSVKARPANVVMVPHTHPQLPGTTMRIRLLPVSAMNILPKESN